MFPAIYLTSFLVACTANLLGISLALFLAQVKQSGPFIVGLAGFSGSLAATITTFLLARYSPGKRRLIFLSAPLSLGVLYFLVPFLPIPAIFLCLIAGNVFCGFFWPTIQRYFSCANDELRAGVFNLSWSAGVILGSFSAGILFALNPRFPFFVALFLSVCSSIVILSRRKSFICANRDTVLAENRDALPPGTIREVRLMSYLHFIASSSVFYLYPKLGLLRGFSPQFIGSVAGILLVSRFVGFFLLMDKPVLLYPAGFAASCTIYFIGSCLVGLGDAPYIVIIGVAILGASGAIAYHNSLQMHLKYGLKTEIHEGIVGAGTFTGALIAGSLGQLFDLPTAYVIIGTGIFLAGLLYNRKYLIGKLTARK